MVSSDPRTHCTRCGKNIYTLTGMDRVCLHCVLVEDRQARLAQQARREVERQRKVSAAQATTKGGDDGNSTN